MAGRCWYKVKKVLDAAAAALHVENFEAHFLEMRQSMGPPWNKDHKIALAAAITALQTD